MYCLITITNTTTNFSNTVTITLCIKTSSTNIMSREHRIYKSQSQYSCSSDNNFNRVQLNKNKKTITIVSTIT